MRWIVLMLAMMCAGSAVGQDAEPPPGSAFIPGKVKAGVIVMDFQDPAPKPKFGKAEEGNKLIAVQLVFGSGEDGKVAVNPMFAEIQCADFAVRTAAMMSAPSPELKASELKKKGDKMMGWVAFEIPTELKASECKLAYGVMEKSDWIPLSDAMAKQPPKDAPK